MKGFGIDAGSDNTRIYITGGGLVLSEPTVIAVDSYTDDLFETGKTARDMIGKTPETVITVCPVNGGVIADVAHASTLMKTYLKKVFPGFGRYKLAVSVPYASTEVEKRALVGAVSSVKSKTVYTVDEPIAAALGIGLDIFEAKGHMTVDVGAGKTSVSVISLGGTVANTTTHFCGSRIDRDIINYVRRKHGIIIGDRSAETAKIKLANTMESTLDFITLNGQNGSDGLPTNVTISNDEIWEAIEDTVNGIIDAIRITLEKLDPELVSDISDSGITFIGSGSKMRGLCEYAEYITGVRCEMAVDVENAVAAGAALALEREEEMRAKGILLSGLK